MRTNHEFFGDPFPYMDQLPENWQEIHAEVFGHPADASEIKATVRFFLFRTLHHPAREMHYLTRQR